MKSGSAQKLYIHKHQKWTHQVVLLCICAYLYILFDTYYLIIIIEKEGIDLRIEEYRRASKDSWQVMEGRIERKEMDRILFQLKDIKKKYHTTFCKN